MSRAFPQQRLAAAFLCAGLFAPAQTPDAAPRFATASIKPEAGPGVIRRDLDPVMLRWHNMPLGLLIRSAFDLKSYQLTGWPDWVNNDRFDVDARTDTPTTPQQKLAMLQTLIVERFGLKFHRETRALDGYALVVVKGGIKMHEVKAGEADAAEPGVDIRSGLIVGHRAKMSEWSSFFSSELFAPFEDDTGLAGAYDFKLEWSRDATPRAGAPEPADADGLSLFSAVQQQLGLKLERKKIPVEVFLIDHLNKTPSDN